MKIYVNLLEAIRWKYGQDVVVEYLDMTKPSATIDGKVVDSPIALVEEYEAATDYIRKRKEEYGSIEEQLDYIVNQGVDEFIKRNQAIKRKFPKPTPKKVPAKKKTKKSVTKKKAVSSKEK